MGLADGELQVLIITKNEVSTMYFVIRRASLTCYPICSIGKHNKNSILESIDVVVMENGVLCQINYV